MIQFPQLYHQAHSLKILIRTIQLIRPWIWAQLVLKVILPRYSFQCLQIEITSMTIIPLLLIVLSIPKEVQYLEVKVESNRINPRHQFSRHHHRNPRRRWSLRPWKRVSKNRGWKKWMKCNSLTIDQASTLSLKNTKKEFYTWAVR